MISYLAECTDLYLGSVSVYVRARGLFSVKRFFTKPPPLSSCSAAACLVLYYRGKTCLFFVFCFFVFLSFPYYFSTISLLFLYYFSTRGNSLLFLFYLSLLLCLRGSHFLSRPSGHCCVSRRWLLLRQDCPGRTWLDGYQGEAQWA